MVVLFTPCLNLSECGKGGGKVHQAIIVISLSEITFATFQI